MASHGVRRYLHIEAKHRPVFLVSRPGIVSNDVEMSAMDTMPLIMMGILGLGAGWIASQLLGQRTELVGNVVTGVAGAYVGGYIQKYAKLDFMQLGNPLLEQLAVATMGAIVVILLARTISPPHARR